MIKLFYFRTKKIKINQKTTIEFNEEDFKTLFDSKESSNDIFIPHVIEPSFGISRLMYCILEHNFKLRQNKNYHVLY